MRLLPIGGLLVLVSFLPSDARAQEPTPGDTVTVVPSDEYGGLAFLAPITGYGHRDFWRTPIRVPVADLSRLGGGGITPERLGGGFMSRTLHGRGADGRHYVFRTVDKFPAQGLPDALQETFVADLIKGQIASLNPSGALVAAPLLDSLGVLHPNPTYYVMPDDPRLGEWRELFAGRLVLFEERPDEAADGGRGFAGATEIKNTNNFRDDLEEDPSNRFAADELLRARLVDLLLGDRDRSINNWLWARFPDGDGSRWRPVPRDRDQVFVNFDGLAKKVSRLFDPRLVEWNDDIPSVIGLSRNAWDIDRNLLVSLDRDEWARITDEVVTRFTDPVLDDALRHMPAAHYELAGERFYDDLRSRRDQLTDASWDLFAIVNEFADVNRTDADELVVVRRQEDGDVRIDVYPRPTSGTSSTGPAWFSKLFHRDDTYEVRIYLHGGDDLVVYEGDGPRSILVRVVAGGGRDDLQVDDEARGRGFIFYDDDQDGDATRAARPGVDVQRRRPTQPRLWPSDGTGPGTPDFWGHWTPAGTAEYSGRNGVVLGVGAQRVGYGFEQDPYRYRFLARVGYATGPAKPFVDLSYEIRNVAHGLHWFADAAYTPLDLLRYSGYGNETSDAEDPDFYDPSHTSARVRTGLRIGGGRLGAEIGGRFRHLESDTTDATLLAEERPYGSGPFDYLTFFGEAHFDGRAMPGELSRGMQVIAGGSITPGELDVTEGQFGEVHGEVRAIIARAEEINPHLAVRLGARKNFGDVPFAEGAFVGGPRSVRGLGADRYLGDASVFASIEARVRLFSWSLAVPADYGILGFVETGRVFEDCETSDEWHTGYGGGLWIAPTVSEYPQLRDVRGVGSVGFSEGSHRFYFGLGYLF